jgi:hypothetical protein
MRNAWIKPAEAAAMLGISRETFLRKYCRARVDGLAVMIDHGQAGQPVYYVLRVDVEKLIQRRCNMAQSA